MSTFVGTKFIQNPFNRQIEKYTCRFFFKYIFFLSLLRGKSLNEFNVYLFFVFLDIINKWFLKLQNRRKIDCFF